MMQIDWNDDAVNSEDYLRRGFGPPITEDGMVFKLQFEVDGPFAMIRVREDQVPIVVRAGQWNHQLTFNFETGIATNQETQLG